MEYELINEAIDYFTKEIKQIEIMLNGSINLNYRIYLENKKEFYALALALLKGESNEQ